MMKDFTQKSSENLYKSLNFAPCGSSYDPADRYVAHSGCKLESPGLHYSLTKWYIITGLLVHALSWTMIKLIKTQNKWSTGAQQQQHEPVTTCHHQFAGEFQVGSEIIFDWMPYYNTDSNLVLQCMTHTPTERCTRPCTMTATSQWGYCHSRKLQPG